MLNDDDNYSHNISYDNLVHKKNTLGQWASNCVLFCFAEDIKETCDDKKECRVLRGEICKEYRKSVSFPLSTN